MSQAPYNAHSRLDNQPVRQTSHSTPSPSRPLFLRSEPCEEYDCAHTWLSKQSPKNQALGCVPQLDNSARASRPFAPGTSSAFVSQSTRVIFSRLLRNRLKQGSLYSQRDIARAERNNRATVRRPRNRISTCGDSLQSTPCPPDFHDFHRLSTSGDFLPSTSCPPDFSMQIRSCQASGSVLRRDDLLVVSSPCYPCPSSGATAIPRNPGSLSFPRRTFLTRDNLHVQRGMREAERCMCTTPALLLAPPGPSEGAC
mmetsp:Transcript_40879/g.123217  ORF Transcript_40879/g.123217 Transcript_40879/m.123217 type:complete len:255 (+) Transcript_40879:893-1657(+)